ncbi:hypothetical protein HK102_010213, partial [Quaeritorhiza haematococci]
IPEYRNQMFLPKDEWRDAFQGVKRYRRQAQPAEVETLAPLDEHGLLPPPADAPGDPPAIRENQKKLREEYDRAIGQLKAMQARGVAPAPKAAPRKLALDPDVTRAFNGRTLWQKKVGGARGDDYLTWPAKTDANWFQATGYLAAVGLHVPDPTGSQDAKSGQAMFRLVEWIKDPSYELEPKTEVVDGSTCVVLAGSLNSLLRPSLVAGRLTDRIWLDRDHGYVVRKREMARDGRVTCRWTTTDLKEVEPGVWLPYSLRGERYPIEPVAELEGKAAAVETIEVRELSINRVPDSLFDMTPREGDRVEDLRGRL